ncbi:methyl-accepting chemotaxis protein [Lachnospiraceae bacterium C10]|nr:methyl-accepting chemotaxis protein [Lachnospiraceae bacterium C10]
MAKDGDKKKRERKRGQRTIRGKVLMLTMPVVVATIVILVGLSSELSKSRLEKKAIAQLQSSITNQGDNIESWMNTNLEFFATAKKTIEAANAKDDELQRMLDNYYGFNKYSPNGVYIAGEDGTIKKATQATLSAGDVKTSQWYKEGLTRINMDYGSVYKNQDGAYVVSASGILNDGSDDIKVISADVDLNQISIIVNSGVKMDGASSILVDTADGTILSSPNSSMVGANIDKQEGDLLQGIAKVVKERKFRDGEVARHMVSYRSIAGTDWELISYAPESLIMAEVNSLGRILILVGVIAVILLIVVISVLVTRIFRPLNDITKDIIAMSSGDFTIEVKNRSNDEIGVMSGKVAEFVESMRGMLSSINRESDKLKGQSDNSNHVSKSMYTASRSQSEAMEGLNNTVDQLAVAVNEIAENATTLAQVVADTRENSDRADESMKETVQITQQGRDDMQELGTAMDQIKSANAQLVSSINQVGEASEEITKIVGMISEIADETNLLSLNASIEAARAGEAGRGFAVVASEIGNLANNSAQSASDINQLIQQVRGLIENVVEQAEASAKSIDMNSELIHTAVSNFDQIYENIKKSNDELTSVVRNIQKVEDVATNVAAISEEQAASTDEILQTSKDMVEHANDITRSSQDVADNSHELADTSESLASYVSRFRI